MKKLFYRVLLIIVILISCTNMVFADGYGATVAVEGTSETEFDAFIASGKGFRFIPTITGLEEDENVTYYKWKYKFAGDNAYNELVSNASNPPLGIACENIFESGGNNETRVQLIGFSKDTDKSAEEAEYISVESNEIIIHVYRPVISVTAQPMNVMVGTDVTFTIVPGNDSIQGYKYIVFGGDEQETTSNTITATAPVSGTLRLLLTAYKYKNEWITINENDSFDYYEDITAIDPTDISVSIDKTQLEYDQDANVTVSGSEDFMNNFDSAMAHNLTLSYWKTGEQAKTTTINTLQFNIKSILGTDYSSGTWSIKPVSAYTFIMFGPSTQYYFNEDPITFTIADPIEYEIVEKYGSINVNDNKNVLFTSTADYNKFYTPDGGIIGKVLVDGELVDPSHYTHVSGSTKVTLKASYLNTLANGEHTLTIVSSDGEASTTFKITRNPKPSPNPGYIVPNTGIDGIYSNNHSLFKVSSLSLLAIGTYLFIKKKENN